MAVGWLWAWGNFILCREKPEKTWGLGGTASRSMWLSVKCDWEGEGARARKGQGEAQTAPLVHERRLDSIQEQQGLAEGPYAGSDAIG